jgi:hypothetical protein
MNFGRSPDSSFEVAAFPSAKRRTVARVLHFNQKLDLQLRGQFRNISFELLKPSTEFPFNPTGMKSYKNHNSDVNVGD